jgi:hypothetical protein
MSNVQFRTNPDRCFYSCYFLIQNHPLFPDYQGYLVLISSAANLNRSCVLEVNDHLSYGENVLWGEVDDTVDFDVDAEESHLLWMGDIVEAEIALDMDGHCEAIEHVVVKDFVEVTLVVVVVERDFWSDVSAVSPLIPTSIVFFVDRDYSFLLVGNGGLFWEETRRSSENELYPWMEKPPWRSWVGLHHWPVPFVAAKLFLAYDCDHLANIFYAVATSISILIFDCPNPIPSSCR